MVDLSWDSAECQMDNANQVSGSVATKVASQEHEATLLRSHSSITKPGRIFAYRSQNFFPDFVFFKYGTIDFIRASVRLDDPLTIPNTARINVQE